jgi:hypothetical protein
MVVDKQLQRHTFVHKVWRVVKIRVKILTRARRVKRNALVHQIWCVAIQDVCVPWVDVDELEKVVPHERVIAFRVFLDAR